MSGYKNRFEEIVSELKTSAEIERQKTLADIRTKKLQDVANSLAMRNARDKQAELDRQTERQVKEQYLSFEGTEPSKLLEPGDVAVLEGFLELLTNKGFPSTKNLVSKETSFGIPRRRIASKGYRLGGVVRGGSRIDNYEGRHKPFISPAYICTDGLFRWVHKTYDNELLTSGKWRVTEAVLPVEPGSALNFGSLMSSTVIRPYDSANMPSEGTRHTPDKITTYTFNHIPMQAVLVATLRGMISEL